jgi:hypothetical protein
MPKKYRAITIFFMLFSAVLAVYIATQGFAIYGAHKNESMSIAKPSIDCFGISYSVSNFSYDGYALSFDLRNNDDSTEKIPSVMVKGVNERFVGFKNFLPKLKRRVVVSDIEIATNFTVYPDNCVSYQRTCYLETKQCENIIG